MRKSLDVVKKHFEKRDIYKNAIIGVEVGVYEGANAVEMLNEIPNLYLLHLVDSYVGVFPYYYHIAKRNLKEYDDRIAWHLVDSALASNHFIDKTIDFIYIDGGHKIDSITRDLLCWWPRLRTGGILCGHDYNTPSQVKTAVDSFAIGKKSKVCTSDVRIKGKGDSDWWIFKNEN